MYEYRMIFKIHRMTTKKSEVQSSVCGPLPFGRGEIKPSDTHARTHAQSLGIPSRFSVFVLFAFRFLNLGSVGGRNLPSVGGNRCSILLINKIFRVRGGRGYGEL